MMSNSDGTWMKFEYDKVGNKIGLKQFDGRSSKFEYDLRNRLVEVKGNTAENWPECIVKPQIRRYAYIGVPAWQI